MSLRLPRLARALLLKAPRLFFSESLKPRISPLPRRVVEVLKPHRSLEDLLNSSLPSRRSLETSLKVVSARSGALVTSGPVPRDGLRVGYPENHLLHRGSATGLATQYHFHCKV